jgi:hypothetical protein
LEIPDFFSDLNLGKTLEKILKKWEKKFKKIWGRVGFFGRI